MRKFSSIFLISAIALVSVFGVFFMLHSEDGSHVECPFDFVQSDSCENITSPLASIAFHAKEILRPAMAGSFASVLMLVTLFAFLFLAAKLPALADPKPLALALALAYSHRPAPLRKFRSWLTIHEKRDPWVHSAMGA